MGLFVTIEGVEGCGKTTIGKMIVDKLISDGYEVIYTREPGGIEIAEQIRKVILDVNNTNMDARTEALLYAASRRQHLVEKVIPALKENKVIICDRFVDSSLAYQGHARGLGIEKVYEINKFAIDTVMPDLTLLFDLDPKLGLERISANKSREVNRLDLEKLEFHKLVREGFLIIENLEPNRVKKVDASKTIEEVFNDAYSLILEALNKYFKEDKTLNIYFLLIICFKASYP